MRLIAQRGTVACTGKKNPVAANLLRKLYFRKTLFAVMVLPKVIDVKLELHTTKSRALVKTGISAHATALAKLCSS